VVRGEPSIMIDEKACTIQWTNKQCYMWVLGHMLTTNRTKQGPGSGHGKENNLKKKKNIVININ